MGFQLDTCDDLSPREGTLLRVSVGDHQPADLQ